MGRADSLEKTLMLGKIEGRKILNCPLLVIIAIPQGKAPSLEPL